MRADKPNMAPTATSVFRALGRAMVMACLSLIMFTVGTSGTVAEAAAEYVDQTSVRFSNPAPLPGDDVTVSGTIQREGTVLASVDGQTIGSGSAAADGSFSFAVSIPDLRSGSYTLVVTFDGIELGSVPILVESESPPVTIEDSNLNGRGIAANQGLDDDVKSPVEQGAPDTLAFGDEPAAAGFPWWLILVALLVLSGGGFVLLRG